MSETPKPTASDTTVKAQLASLTLRLAELQKLHEQDETEKAALKKQNIELASVIENDLKAETKIRIMAMSNYKDTDLEDMSIEQLQQIEETLSKSKGDAATSFKSIRAGGASRQGQLTVGGLKGKTRQEILEMEGEF